MVVTALDHDANVSPWLLVAEDHDLVIRTAPLRPDDVTLDVEALEGLIGERTRVVAFTLASNAVGLGPRCHGGSRRRLTRSARWRGPTACTSPRTGVSAPASSGSTSCSARPTSSSARAWASRPSGLSSRSRCRPTASRPAEETPPGHRFEAGTQSHEAVAGATAAIDYLRGLGDGDLDAAFTLIDEHETRLSARFLSDLPDGIELYGIRTPEGRTPTFCFNVGGRSPREVAELLGEQNIYVWDGNYYALEPMRALGIDDSGGAVRAGFLHYTTEEEVDRLLEALADLAP